MYVLYNTVMFLESYFDPFCKIEFKSSADALELWYYFTEFCHDTF